MGEEEEKEVRTVLKASDIQKGLSKIARTHDGSSFAFTVLNLAGGDEPVLEEPIQDLKAEDGLCDLNQYEFIQHINLSKNDIRDISTFVSFPHLLTINCSQNSIRSIQFMEEFSSHMQFVQAIDLSQNKITELTNIPQPRVTRVNLSENEISRTDEFKGHDALLSLDLKKNKLISLAGIANMPLLTELNISENEIKDLIPLKNLPSLKKLNATTNKLESLDDLPDLPSLEVLDIGANVIEKPNELPKLSGLRRLRTLIMAGNPWADEKDDGLKKEVLIALDELNIKTVNEDEVTAEDRTEAAEEKKARIQAAKEAEEEAAREAAEKAAAGENAEGEEAE